MHEFIQYIQSYLDSDQTPGGAGNIFWATVYILLVFGGLSVAVIAHELAGAQDSGSHAGAAWARCAWGRTACCSPSPTP